MFVTSKFVTIMFAPRPFEAPGPGGVRRAATSAARRRLSSVSRDAAGLGKHLLTEMEANFEARSKRLVQQLREENVLQTIERLHE
jgi:hypothetical protein